MAYVDFAEVKAKVAFKDAIQFLDLKLKAQGNQWRGTCPQCGGADRGLVLTEGRGFYCFSEKTGGDVIALAAHVLHIPAKDAARVLAEKAGLMEQYTSTSTSRTVPRQRVPESEVEKRGLSPLSYLEHAHDAVIALGFDPEFCERHGIGYSPRGVVRGSVAIPFRDEDGVLLGYIGVQDITYLPADFQTNVVAFPKRA